MDEKQSSSGGLHWKSKIRTAHTKMLARGERSGERADFVELWETIASKNIPLWYLQLLGAPEKEGWLVKKGGIGGALTKRWFVLIGPLLFYYSSDQSDARAKGVVPLCGAEIALHTVPDKELAKYEKKAQKGGLKIGLCWTIKTRMREFVISCDTTALRDEWTSACFNNSEVALEETCDNPKYSLVMLRKLLLPSDQMRKELETMLGGSSGGGGGVVGSAKRPMIPPLSPRGGPSAASDASSPLSSPSGSPREEQVTGGLLGGAWRFDADTNVLSAYEVKTDGSWPFDQEVNGLFVTCRYLWTGSKLRAEAGSASRGEWNGRSFKWSCSSKSGASRLVYEYVWERVGTALRPRQCGNGLASLVAAAKCAQKFQFHQCARVS